MGKFQLYKNWRFQWRWRFRARNGRIIAVSSEGYYNRSDCIHGIEIIAAEIGKGVVIESPGILWAAEAPRRDK